MKASSTSKRKGAQKRAATGRQASMMGLTVAILFLFVGCSDKPEIREKAEWLCKYDQLDSPSAEALPDDEDLTDYLHERDLAYLQERGTDGRFGAAVKGKLEPIVRVGTQVKANHTECSVEAIEIEDGWARAELVRMAPDPDLGLDILLDADGEEQVLKKYRQWYENASRGNTTEYTVEFVETDEGWRGYLGLERRELQRELDALEEELADVGETLDALREEKEKIERARERLADFEVVSAALDSERMFRFGPTRTIIELDVNNGTEHAISRAYFYGRYRTPGRSVAWEEGPFNHEFDGGLEPGESATWRLTTKFMGGWHGAELRDDAELEVDVVGLEDADGDTLWEVSTRDADSYWSDDLIWGTRTEDPEEQFEKVSERHAELEAEAAALRDQIDDLSPASL